MIGRTYTAVIPVIPKHIKYLFALLNELENSTKLFQEIWIVASSTDEKSEDSLRALQSKVNLPKLKIDFTNLPRTAGQNRNVGFEKASSDYICFLDADDSYDPRRLEIIDKMISSSGAQVIYHDYFRLAPRAFFRFSRSNRTKCYVDTHELFHNTFGINGRAEWEETGIRGDTNIILPKHLKRLHRIQHGHVTVSTKVTERFSDMKTGEDGRFARDCLYNHLNVIYIPKRLSIYDRLTIRNITNSISLRTLRTLAILKNKFIPNKITTPGEN